MRLCSTFSGINFNDVLARYGLLEDTPRTPFIPGFECSGEVMNIGPNVTHVDVRVPCSRWIDARLLFVDAREVIVSWS